MSLQMAQCMLPPSKGGNATAKRMSSRWLPVFCALVQIPLAVAGGSHAASQVPEEEDSAITMVLGGDVMLGRLVNEVVLERGPKHIWGSTLDLLRSADATLVNLECVIAKGGERFFPPRVFYFRADPRTAQALSVAGIDFVSLANNHALDFQAEGLLETIDHLDGLGIAHAGAGRNRKAASKPAIIEVSGVKIGVVASADHFREYGAGEDSPGTNLIEVNLEGKTVERVRTAVRAARTAGAELVVFSIHWGPNMRQVPTPNFIDFAHAVMDAGADIFHGHSAHIFQGIEVYDGKLILYDTGDLIDDYYVDPDLRNDQQLLYIVKATQAGIERLEMVPLLINNMQVNIAQGENFEVIRERLARLSRRFGTEISCDGNRLVIELSKKGSK